MIRVDADGEGAIATRSGYVRIQGRQDDVALVAARERVRDARPRRSRSPAEVAAALDGRSRAASSIGGLGEWDLGYWVAAADQRAGLARRT